ncbi:helix-turn-helix transcriptional regulator [Streptomyces sp. NPDC047869]|uniref:helix-turn-helix domain-containing protein n=1 Tax=Streptomyces sp. NPDC047869 TaxID=3154709 RepID=UPI0034561E27
MSLEDLRRISAVRELVASGETRTWREGRRLTLREVADAVGVSPSTIHRWEQSRSAPRGAYALRLAATLDIDTETA